MPSQMRKKESRMACRPVCLPSFPGSMLFCQTRKPFLRSVAIQDNLGSVLARTHVLRSPLGV